MAKHCTVEDQPLEEEVLEVLSSLILFKNRADAKGWRDAFENMAIYMERVGLTPDEISKLHVIHVAGTKGKGSTCAMVENVLQHCGYRTGLYTSPHLVDVRERVRIDGHMVGKEVFEREFWYCYERFKSQATEEVGVPGYFRFMTLLALRIFLVQSVDVIILEVGIGGRLDATNVIPEPVVCGITSLGFDHMETLGDTLPKIAREKAGIMKRGRPCFTVTQPDDAMEALQEVAEKVQAPLRVVGAVDSWKPKDATALDHMALGGQHQRINAGMATQLCATFELEALKQGWAAPGAKQRVEQLAAGILPDAYTRALAATTWPGRSQVVEDQEFIPSTSATATTTSADTLSPSPISRLSFFIDGAHTPESMVTCAEWFASAASTHPSAAGTSQIERILLFNCMKERDPTVLLPALSSGLASRGISLSHTIFVPPHSMYGFLPTKKNPHPTSSPSTASQDAAKQSDLQEAPVPPPVDYSWQLQLQRTWVSHCAHNHPAKSASAPTQSTVIPTPPTPGLPLQDSRKAAILPSLGSAIEWLHSMARARPQVQMQVLVTGSLYLVGDVLRLLGRAPK